MIGDKIPNYQYGFLAVYAILFLAAAFFLNRFIIRKKSNVCINIICVFLWFTIFLMILFFPMDLFSDFLIEDTEEQKQNKKIISAVLFWNFYIFGFVVVDLVENCMKDGNFKIKSKICSVLKKNAIFVLIFIGIGFAVNGILQLLVYAFKESNFLIIAIKILKTLIAIPMLVAYLMFLGCSLGDMPKDLYIKFNYPLRAKKLCWRITHVMRKYKKETEFLILSINKIKMTQDLIKQKLLAEVNQEITEIKDKMKKEVDEEEKKKIKDECDNIEGLKELYDYQNEMNDMLYKLDKTVKDFNLNISLDSIDNKEEKRPLKDLKELVSINEAHYIYQTQIFRLNYQKYEIYKEWAEIKTYMMDYENKDLSQKLDTIINLDNESMYSTRGNSDLKSKKTISESFINDDNDDEKLEFQKAILTRYKTTYFKVMPKISIVLMILCILYGILMIIGQIEYTFNIKLITSPVFRAWFTCAYLIIPIRIFPIFFTLFATTYAFTRIKSDMISCVYGHSQTEPCHALFFVGMVAKFVCPVCYLMTKITFTEVKLDANKSKIIEYFHEQFGFLESNSDNEAVYAGKLALLALFIKAIIMNIAGCYGTIAYKKYKYLSYNAKYIEKELEIEEGDGILCDMNKIYGCNFEQIKEDFIIE